MWQTITNLPDEARPLDTLNTIPYVRIDDIYINMNNHEAYKVDRTKSTFMIMEERTTNKGSYISVNVDGKRMRLYINDIVDIINNTKPNIVNQATTQDYNIEYLTSLPFSASPIKQYKNKQLKLMFWFDESNHRIIKLNPSKCKYKYRYIRAENIMIYFINGDSERIPTNQLTINH